VKVAFLDTVHPLVSERFSAKGWQCDFLYSLTRDELKNTIHQFDGIILRSRIKMDADFLQHATQLKFIGRPGAGLENIDLAFCEEKNIQVFRSPEGNCDAVGEHATGMLLMLLNHLKRADTEVRNGIWNREGNRGHELKGKTIAIIGYGFMGQAFAKKLKGFEVNVIAYDKYKQNFSDEYAKETSLEEVFTHADVVSLHTPETPETLAMIDAAFLQKFKKSIYFFLSNAFITDSPTLKAKLTGTAFPICL
jgi:D-3-phosphoglycerate dehydrogenase